VRARHLRIDPGPITIELHPDLADDERMMRHVYAHELLHASGLTAHSEEHDRLTSEVAPAPPLSESPLLQRLRAKVLADQPVQSWTCEHCGYTWERTTVRTPTRCIKCARPLRSRR
jgi:rubrerythrin